MFDRLATARVEDALRRSPVGPAIHAVASHVLWRSAIAVVGFLLALAMTDATAVEVHCAGVPVVVRAPDRNDSVLACAAARDAIGYLASLGLEVSGRVALDLVQRLPPTVSDSAAGCFDEPRQRALVLGYRQFARRRTWFGLPIGRAMYRAVIAHEVAHAVAACNFKRPRPTVQAMEYIAYVTMLATMPEPLRDRVLAKYPGDGFDGDWQIRADIYLFDPMYFGVQAYRHFSKPENGRDFVQAVLAGRVLVE